LRSRPAFSLCAILGGAAHRLWLRHRCGLGLNRNPPFLDRHYLQPESMAGNYAYFPVKSSFTKNNNLVIRFYGRRLA
jgi:hypothetical protein